MSRVLLLDMSTQAATDECHRLDIGVSALEALPAGGVRLVTMSSDGAEVLRTKLKGKLIKGEVIRARHRPTRPLW
ncbi:MAG TPA: hypothetical protein VGD23_00960 [Sphingomicrobium sp.]